MRPESETVPGLLAARRENDADRPALVTAEDAVTYRELDEASAALAAKLVVAGVVKGDRVGLLARRTAKHGGCHRCETTRPGP